METLQIILPVIITLLLGMVLRKRRLLTRDGVNTMKFVAVNIGLPAVLLHTFAATSYTAMDLVIPLMMYAVCIAAWFCGKVLGRRLGMNNAFVPFLVDHYQNVYVVDYRYYRDNLTQFIIDNRVQDLIFVNNVQAITEKVSNEILSVFS